MKRLASLILGLVVAGCGLREPLQMPEGEGPPPVPATAQRAPTTEEMLALPPIARPRRVDELLSQSEERSQDRFDLPPADIAAEENVVEEDEPE